MKINKSILKGIIKECLIEILAEGMGSTTRTMIESHQAMSKNNVQQVIDKPIITNPLVEQRSLKQSPIIQAAAANCKIPGMEDILADTLQTSYVQQTSAEMPSLLAASKLNESMSTDVHDAPSPSKSWSDIAFGK